MATISVKFRPAPEQYENTENKKQSERRTLGLVYYLVIHNRKVRQLASAYRMSSEDWNKFRSGMDSGDALRKIREGISLDLDRLRRILSELQGRPTGFTVDEVVAEYRRLDDMLSLANYVERLVCGLKSQGRLRTAETYKAALASFSGFWKTCGAVGEPQLDGLTVETIDAYNGWLKRRGVVDNTVSFYNRVLRAIYNHAVDSEALLFDRRPFRRAYTGVDHTVKRAIPLEAVSRIAALDLSLYPPLDYARDMFILSFALRGMSFIDMAFLRKENLCDGRLVYIRRKTGQRLEIEWTAYMSRILEKYPRNETAYLLPIIRNPGIDERGAYRNAAYNINRSLKTIARMIGLNVRLTMYSARHSWASAALSKGVPISVISEGMGHDSERTTRIYLAQFDTAAVDKANALIMESLTDGN